MVEGCEALRKWIEKRGLEQQDVAELLGVHESYVSQLLHRARYPALGNAVRIERITGIPVESWLVKRTPKVPKRKLVDEPIPDFANS